MSAASMTPPVGSQGAGDHEDDNGHEKGVEQKDGKRKRPGKKFRDKQARKAAEAAKAASAAAVDESSSPPENDSDDGHKEAPAVPSNPPGETPEEPCLDSKAGQALHHDEKEAGGKPPDAVLEAMDQLRKCQREADEQRGQLAKYEEEIAEHESLQKAAEEEAARSNKRVEALERSLAEAEEKLCAEQAANADLRAELRGAKSAMASFAREKKQLEKEVRGKEEEVDGLKEEVKEAKLASDMRLASLEKALGECVEEMARSSLVQENERLVAELAESQEELVRVNQRLQDSEAELKEERRRRQRSGSELSAAPRRHTRMGSELSQLGGGETPGEGHPGDEQANGKELAGSPAKEQEPLVAFEKRCASVAPSLTRTRMTTSTGTQTDPAGNRKKAQRPAASNGGVPRPPTCRPPLPVVRRRGELKAPKLLSPPAIIPPRSRLPSLSGPVDFAALYNVPATPLGQCPTSGPGPTKSVAAVHAAAHQNREALIMGGSAEDNGEAAVGAEVRASGAEEAPEFAGPEPEPEKAVDEQETASTTTPAPTDPTDAPKETTDAKPVRVSVATFLSQRVPTNPFLWLLWLLSVLFLVSLAGKENREWELANGGSGFAFFDLLDNFLPSDPLMRCVGLSIVNTNMYRHYAPG